MEGKIVISRTAGVGVDGGDRGRVVKRARLGGWWDGKGREVDAGSGSDADDAVKVVEVLRCREVSCLSDCDTPSPRTPYTIRSIAHIYSICRTSSQLADQPSSYIYSCSREPVQQRISAYPSYQPVMSRSL